MAETKDTRWHIRVPDGERKWVELAAQIEGLPTSEFIRRAAREKANQVIERVK